MSSRILKGINAEDIRVGDVIRTTSGVVGTVLETRGFRQHLGLMEFLLDCMGDQPLHLRVLEIVELRHRPGSVDEQKISDLCEEATYRLGFSRQDADKMVGRLLEACISWELGKPEGARVLGVSDDPREAAIDASCGYLGGGPVVR